MKTFLAPLTPEAEAYYLKCLKDGDQRAKDVLVERNLRLVAHVAKKYATGEKERSLEEMISIGTIGLIKAIQSFDEGKGKLSTYAARCIENELLMMLREEKKRSREISLYEPIGTDKEGNEISLFDVVESREEQIDKICEVKDDLQKLKVCLQNKLTNREYEIITRRYGLEGRKEETQREIAKDLGISRSYISRIEKRALEKLRKAME